MNEIICERLKQSESRLKGKECCPFCHSTDVMYNTRAGRVCCIVGKVVIPNFSFTGNVEMPEVEQARAAR